MSESSNPSQGKWQTSAKRVIIALRGKVHSRLHKFRHNLFVISLIVILLASLALLNAYFRFADVSSYDIKYEGFSSFLLAGYLGMFLTLVFLPIPDYFLIPSYGFLSSLGVFDPYITFLICVIAAILPIGYLPGRFAGRPLLLKGISYFGVSEKALVSAEKWLMEHGKFSVFISTFIPFFYTLISIAAGVLKMNAARFFLASALGFGIRYAFLEYIGYNSIFIFTASFDYSQRVIIALLLIVASIYVVRYLLENFRSRHRETAS